MVFRKETQGDVKVFMGFVINGQEYTLSDKEKEAFWAFIEGKEIKPVQQFTEKEIKPVQQFTEKEIRLLDKLKQIAGITNEIYGTNYPGPLKAFCTFFDTEHGKVVLKSNIAKEDLVRYSMNL